MPLGMTLLVPAGRLPCSRSTVVFDSSPHAFTTLPSASYSTTGGDPIELVPSWPERPPVWNPRLTVMTWSFESMQLPPTSPVTHWWPLVLGRGLGQDASTVKRGVRFDPRS